MGIAERREREKEQRRNAIVDAAERVFFSKGVAGATMDEVAEAAELSKGTLYLYFESKDDLYLAIITRGIKILHQMFDHAVASEEKGADKVAAIGRTYIEFSRLHPEYFTAMLYFESSSAAHDEQSRYSVECMTQSNETFAICADAVQAGIDDNTIRSDVDPMKTALTLWGLTTGLLQIVSLKGEMIGETHGVDPKELIETFFDLIDRSLRP